MKQRAKVYKGKRVVMGDKNRVTKHEIHVNDIPQQGGESSGGNSEGGSASSMEYVAFDSEKDLLVYGDALGIFSYLIKYPTKIETISLMMADKGSVNDAIAFAIDTKVLVDFQGERKTVKDWALSFGADLDLLPRLTEEEFYTLN